MKKKMRLFQGDSHKFWCVRPEFYLLIFKTKMSDQTVALVKPKLLKNHSLGLWRAI